MPVAGQLGTVGEAVTMVVGCAGQCFDPFVEVLEHFTAMLERAGLVFAAPAFFLSGSFSSPGLVVTPIGPALGEEPSSNTGSQGSQYAHASNSKRYPKRCGTHASMMVVGSADPQLVANKRSPCGRQVGL